MIAKGMLQLAELGPDGRKQLLQLPQPQEQPQLWRVETSAFRPVVDLWADTVLDDGEKARATAFRKSGDRATYQAAHTALRFLLGAYLGTEPRDVPLERLPCSSCPLPHGRPVVRGNRVHFSLSHCDGICLLAFAAAPVGVDVEKVFSPAVADEVGPILHPREAAELRAYSGPDRAVAFARVWTRKEAYLKGLGTGLGRDPSLDYLGCAPEGPVSPPGWTAHDVSAGEGHAAALAVQQR
ncbi:4'-phosphopantetheinyl transferase superfamily protein (plasmid) [Streptomyces sp. NBC_00440]|uniref:4'-phosphopantetheinyl transferase family protein n=1 Tax=unclassified Streptomyces TaxID=2593676 RepID=UPI002E202E0D|nr:4'-phosphopantetheinyl transferase superfamily protein [Streptomyces sp. NBC_00963]